MTQPASHPEPVPIDPAQIDRLLPQVQCRKCGFDGCAPYAEAISRGEAPINRCPPGGEATIVALATLLNRPMLPLDASLPDHVPDRIAVIDEAACIGCTLCIKACPTDAILGAAKRMHAVLTAECSGCELCLPPCPVDCITMEADPRPGDAASRARRAVLYRARVQDRPRREARRAALQRQRPRRTAAAQDGKSPLVALAMQRARRISADRADTVARER